MITGFLIATAYGLVLSAVFIGLVSLPRHCPPRIRPRPDASLPRVRAVRVLDDCEVHGHAEHWQDVDGQLECRRCAAGELDPAGVDRLLDAVREYRGGTS